MYHHHHHCTTGVTLSFCVFRRRIASTSTHEAPRRSLLVFLSCVCSLNFYFFGFFSSFCCFTWGSCSNVFYSRANFNFTNGSSVARQPKHSEKKIRFFSRFLFRVKTFVVRREMCDRIEIVLVCPCRPFSIRNFPRTFKMSVLDKLMVTLARLHIPDSHTHTHEVENDTIHNNFISSRDIWNEMQPNRTHTHTLAHSINRNTGIGNLLRDGDGGDGGPMCAAIIRVSRGI